MANNESDGSDAESEASSVVSSGQKSASSEMEACLSQAGRSPVVTEARQDAQPAVAQPAAVQPASDHSAPPALAVGQAAAQLEPPAFPAQANAMARPTVQRVPRPPW